MELFIGLVTHAGTRFPESSSTGGLAKSIQRSLEPSGWFVDVQVFAEDRWSADTLEITPDAIRRSITEELAVESRWRRFHGGGHSLLAARLPLWLRSKLRLARFIGPGTSSRNLHRGQAMVKRLVNIELAHTALMQQGTDSGSRWTLILEDDAHGDAEMSASAIRAVNANAEATGQPVMVNLSRSFGEGELGIHGKLTPIRDLPGGAAHFEFLSADKPVTNTVCAVLYRTSFLELLVKQFASMPLDPVIPIDWKLNAALMSMNASGLLQSGDSWLCRNAPIVQRSMHA